MAIAPGPQLQPPFRSPSRHGPPSKSQNRNPEGSLDRPGATLPQRASQGLNRPKVPGQKAPSSPCFSQSPCPILSDDELVSEKLSASATGALCPPANPWKMPLTTFVRSTILKFSWSTTLPPGAQQLRRPWNGPRAISSLVLPLVLVLSMSSTSSASAAAEEDPCTALHDKLVSYSRLSGLSPRNRTFLWARPSDVVNCTRSLAFDSERDLGSLESLIKYFKSFYSLLHAAQRSPDPRLPSSYDVVGKLQRLKTQQWSSAEEFYQEVSRAVDGLNDGHTGLELGCPPFVHRLALPLVGVVEGGLQLVRTAPEALLIPKTAEVSSSPPFEFNPTVYTSSLVLEIDGQPAWEYMVAWAEENDHVYHDLGQRLNHAFAHLKWSNGTRARSCGSFGTRFHNPNADSVLLKLVRPGRSEAEEVAVPWLSYTPASNLKGFTSTAAYARTFCLPQTLSPDAAALVSTHDAKLMLQLRADAARAIGALQRQDRDGGGRASARAIPGLDIEAVGSASLIGTVANPGSAAGEGFLRGISLSPMRLARVKGTPKPFRMKSARLDLPLSQATEICQPEDYWKVYKLSDGKTAVVCVNNFLPSLPADTPAEYLRLLTFYAYETAKAFYTADKNSDRIIIDVSRNGGGATLLIPWVMELLVGSYKFPSPRNDMEHFLQFLAETDLVKQMRDEDLGAYDWRVWSDVDEFPFTQETQGEFFYPLRRKRFGGQGIWGQYSSFFKESNPSLGELLEMLLQSAWGSKPYILFSDGQCFSACSSFAISMKSRFGIKLVSIGGLRSQPMAFSAAGGGFVSEDVETDILSSFSEDVASMADAPERFKVNMHLAMRWTNGFLSDSSPAPIEFTFVPADHKVDYTIDNIVDPSLQYLEVAKYF